jgi:hypothetical protein
MPLSVQKRIAIHAPSFPIFQFLRCIVSVKVSVRIQCPRRNSPLGRYYPSVFIFRHPVASEPSYPNALNPLHVSSINKDQNE